ncbi:MAG: YgiQ family radical SAM protein [Candidatus Adiutrix sp.]
MKKQVNNCDGGVPLRQPSFLPTSKVEMESLGWEEIDILLVQGDGYLDHPAQGPALLGRWLVAHGFKVGLISQPNWHTSHDFEVMGRPKLFAAISAGSMDSMLAHYTAFRKKRSDDALTPGGQGGRRPNRATLVYTSLLRQTFPGLIVAIGGLEASLRRLSHYDFWQDRLRASVLLESKADILVYGPGELPLLEIAQNLKQSANNRESLWAIGGTCLPINKSLANFNLADFLAAGGQEIPSHEDILANPKLLMEATLKAEKQVHQGEHGPWIYQPSGGRGVLMFPPASPLSEENLDFIYGLPFSRKQHPSIGLPIPALNMLATSITTHRGCGGGCSFCSLALHQGRHLISRSARSIIAEASLLGQNKPVALSDVGAATANLWGAKCQRKTLRCQRKSCLWPVICPHLKADQKKWVGLLKAVAQLPNIKQVRVASGLRYDLALADEKSLGEFLKNFVGGQLKVAPEHFSPQVLRYMRKPNMVYFEKFLAIFNRLGARTKQYIIPYLISGFPGSTEGDMRQVGEWFKQKNWRPQQVQSFIPTPGTVATAMYYGEINEAGEKIEVTKTDRERLKHHHLISA